MPSRKRKLVTALVVAFALLILGTVPGSSTRATILEREAPPLPEGFAGNAEVLVATLAGGLPIAGAHVTGLAIVGGRAYLAASGTTDASGHVRLTKLPEGETWLLVNAGGWARASTHAVLTRGQRLVTLELVREHVLEVVVKDDLGKPLMGADIEAAGSEPLPIGAQTDADGLATVHRLLPAPWVVTARAPGYESLTRRSIREGERLVFTLRKLGAIDVRVLSGDEPTEATIVVAGGEIWPARSVETDRTGHARIASLASGSYALRATAGERVSPIELGLTLERGEEKEVVLRLVPGRFVSARVMDGEASDASPIAMARVSLAEGGVSPFPLEGTSDRDGRVRLGPFAPGPALLSARAEGYVPKGLVEVPESGEPVTLVLVRAGTLTGRVVDGRGFPIDGASLEIVGTDPFGAPIDDDPRRTELREAQFDAALAAPRALIPEGELGVVPGPVPAIPHGFYRPSPAAGAPAVSLAEPWVTKSDGTFRIAPVTPGRLRAIVRHPQFVEVLSDAVTLAPGAEAELEIVMKAGGSIEGRVVDSSGRGVAGARVTVAAVRGSLERSVLTATDGTFAFASLPDAVTLTAFASGAPGEPSAHASITVPEGTTKTVTLTLPEARPSLLVRVKDDRGYPLDAVQVSVTSLEAALPLRTTVFTDVGGEATVPNAKGLTLRIEARAPGHATKIVKVEVGADQLEVVLGLAETLVGLVRAPHGEPIVDAEVAVTTDVGVSHGRTDKTGAFLMPDVVPGSAHLAVRARGYAPSEQAVEVSVSASHRTTLGPIELAEEGVAEGTVVDSRGDPVPGARVAKDRVPTYLAVGATPPGIAVTDARGRFHLGGLPAGTLDLEAYAPDFGRALAEGIRVSAGGTASGIRIQLVKDKDDRSQEPAASGGVAVTLGETDGEPREVVIVDVAESSEAERAGLLPGDVVLAVDGGPVHTMGEARVRLAGPLADDVVLLFRRGDAVPESVRIAREPIRK